MPLSLNRLRQLRKETKATQQEVADALNITVRRYQSYESRNVQPDPETLRDLAAYFKVTVDYLLGTTNIREAPTEFELKLLEMIMQLPSKDKNMIADLGIEDVKYLRLIHDLPDEHKELLLRIKPSDVDMIRHLRNMTDKPVPYFIQDNLIGVPRELTQKGREDILMFLKYLVERYCKKD